MNLWRYLLYGCGQFGMMALARFFFTLIIQYSKSKNGFIPGALQEGPNHQGGDRLFPVPLEDALGDPGLLLFGAAATVGAVFLGFRIFDGVTDPIAGMVSDGWVKRGRMRRTLLWFAFLFPPLGLAMIFAPDGAMPEPLRWTLLCGGMFVFFVGYTFYAIPYWSLMEDFAEGDEGKRRVLSNVLGAGLLMATLAGFLVSGDLINAFGYRGAALWFSGPALILMVLPYFAQPKGLKPAKIDEASKEKEPGAFESFKIAFKHRRFLAVLAIFAGSQMSFSVMSGAALVIIEQLLDGQESDLKFVMGPFLIGSLPCFALVPWLSKTFGWQRSVAGASVALAFVYIGTAFLGADLIMDSKIVTAGVVFGLGGPMAAVLLGMEGEAITACASEAGGKVVSVYFGVFNLVIKAFNGLAVFLTATLATLSEPEHWGPIATRAMGVMAGCMLVIGVVAYFFISPRTPMPTADVGPDATEPKPDATEPEPDATEPDPPPEA